MMRVTEVVGTVDGTNTVSLCSDRLVIQVYCAIMAEALCMMSNKRQFPRVLPHMDLPYSDGVHVCVMSGKIKPMTKTANFA